VNHQHRKVPHALFAHPVSANIDPKQVFSVFEEVGADVTSGGRGQVKMTLNGHTHFFHETRHSLSREAAVEMRKFPVTAGLDPDPD